MHAKQPVFPSQQVLVQQRANYIDASQIGAEPGISIEDLAFLFAWNGLIARGESPKGAFTKAGAYIDELGLK